MVGNTVSDGLSQRRRDGVADLYSNFNSASAPFEVIGECLQSCSLPVSNRSVFRRMKIPAFFGFVEFSADGASRRPVPLQPAEKVSPAFRLPNPALRR